MKRQKAAHAINGINALISAGVVASALAVPAMAEEDKKVYFEEIVVTAQKREESVLDVPASLSAFSAEQLDKSGITNVLDLANFTPGLSVEPSRAGGGSLYIRGIGSNLLGAGVDPSVAVYQDGVYVARHALAFQDFIDVERVEVLRGPQGTLYGRNATGGAINVIHKKPSETFEFDARVDYGNYDKQGAAVRVSGALVEDALFGGLTYSKQQRDNYSYNRFLRQTLDGEDSEYISGTLVWQASDNFEAVLRYTDYSNDAAGNIPFKNILRGPTTVFALPEPSDEFVVNNDFAPGGNTNEMESAILELTWDVGDATLKSLTGYRKIDATSTFDTDGTNLSLGFNIFQETSDMISQEFQLNLPISDSLDLVAGLYYYDEENDSNLDFQFPLDPAVNADILADPFGILQAFNAPFFDVNGMLPTAGVTAFGAANKTEAYAAFGELTWSVSDEFRLTFGLRYSKEEKSFDSVGQIGPIATDYLPILGSAGIEALFGVPVAFQANPFWVYGNLGPGVNSDSADWSDITGRIVAEYDLNDDLMLYASVSEGFKSGGFNSSDTGLILPGQVPQGSFDPETIMSYEMGLKGSAWDGRIQGTLSAFFYDYKDLQVRFVDSINGTLPISNAAGAEIKGLEFEGQAYLTDQFKLDWSLALLDSEYKDFDTAQDVVTGLPVDLSGEPLLRTPDTKASLGAEYTHLLEQGGSITARGEWLYQDEQRFGQSTQPFLESGDYSYFNARLIWVSGSSDWTVSLWGQNLNDDVYETSRSFNNLQGGLAIYGTPRTYGLTVSYSYQ